MTPETTKVTRTPSDDGVRQEQPLPAAVERNRKDITSIVVDKTVEAMEKTVNAVEKTVNAVDPLHIFAPCIQPTRLVMKTGFFSTVSSKAFPIVECRTGFTFHDLQATYTKDDLLVIQDSSTGKTAVVVERVGEGPEHIYRVLKATKTHDGQEPVKKNDGQDLYALAKVERASPRDFHVLMDGETEPSYTIEKAGIPANYATNYFIKQPGVKEEVASTHPWQGSKYMLVANPGTDAVLMLCLGIIADDAKVGGHKESFLEMVNNLHPKTLVRKLTSSSESDKKEAFE